MPTVFFSYSHKDEALRDELEIHLAPLKRQGVIEAWHDRRIDAGEDFHGAISQHLERADVILLLVSPYLLDSDYCYDVEMARAMQRHEAGEARVIPVILDPCDWHSAPFGKLLAVPTDGKPVSKFPNRHDALLEVAKAVRKAVESTKDPAPVARPAVVPATATGAHRPDIRSSNLRVKKTFTDHERDTFLDDTYEYIAKFFEQSLDELSKRNPEITSRFKRVDANRFTAYIYRSGKSVSECSISLRSHFGSTIAYSSSAVATNSYNETLSVVDDCHSLFMKSMGLSAVSHDSTQQLSAQGAAETLWALLMRPLQQ